MPHTKTAFSVKCGQNPSHRLHQEILTDIVTLTTCMYEH